MAYTDDSVKAKLSALNETQESIVTVAQWIMFHRRQADRTAQLWMQRLRDSTATKRLNLMYLANEVIQQSKARRKNEFVLAFSPIIVEASTIAYKGATHDIQQKLRRVIEVWRQRQIFEPSLQEGIEARVDELDKSRGAGKKQSLGGSLFSNSVTTPPKELLPLLPLKVKLEHAEIAAQSSLTAATTEYEKLTDPSTPAPPPPVHAARLSAVLKTLANAEGAVAESIRARRALLEAVEKMVNNHKSALADEEAAHARVASQREMMEDKKREVEDGIMRGLSEESPSADLGDHHNSSGRPFDQGPAAEPERPVIESLTPPPVESLTPVESPHVNNSDGVIAGILETDRTAPERANNAPLEEAIPTVASVMTSAATAVAPAPPVALGADLLSSLTTPQVRARSEDSPSNDYAPELGIGGSAKRRKINKGGMDDEFSEFSTGDAMDGIDADVAEMLGRE